MKLNLTATMLAVLLSLTSGAVLAREDQTPYQREYTSTTTDIASIGTEGNVPEEVVVTATRLKTPSRQIGSSITVITSKQIEEMQKSTLLDLLRDLPSLDVVQTGGHGGTTSVFIRGAKPGHTLILIDGIEMNDPISPDRSYNLANLTTDNIERIEIIRGPQSTLYGSDAIGGVINIITKKGRGKPGGFVSVKGGSFDTFRERAGLNGASGLINYSMEVSRLDTEGISSAGAKYGNQEKDGYRNTSISVRLGVTPVEDLDGDFILRYIDARADIDNTGGKGGDDPNSTLRSKELFLRAQARLIMLDGKYEQKLGFSLTDHDRNYNNDTDPGHPSDLSRSSYDGKTYSLDWQHNLYLYPANTLTMGLEQKKEQGRSDYYSESAWGPYTSRFEAKSARTTGYYAQDQVKLRGSWFTTLGIRLDDHSRFGTKTTYRITSAYLIRRTRTKIRGSYGTGFKSPSLFQLYSRYGDEDLKPEESTGWDAGVDQSFFHKRLTIGATYFHNSIDNMIEFDSGTSTYMNIDRAYTKGVELSISAQPYNDLTMRASYTHTETEDRTTGEGLLRRPKNKFAFDLNYHFLKRGNLNLEFLYVGKRFDTDYSTFPATRVELDNYVLVNLAGSYQIVRNIQVTGRMENLLDQDYEEVKGYGTPGISGFAGIKVSF